MNNAEILFRKNYHKAGCRNFDYCEVNHIVVYGNNTIEHEYMKAQVAIDLIMQGHNIITEACRGNVRRDIVDLTDEQEIEVVNKNDKIEVLEKYKKDNVVIIKVND